MESFKPIETYFDTITNSTQNNIIKVKLSTIFALIKNYDTNKGMWRRWVAGDHEGITALRTVLRPGTKATDKDRLLDPIEMYNLLCVLMNHDTLQNTLSSDIFMNLRDEVGTDLITLAQLIHKHNQSIFTPHVISLLAIRKDNFAISDIKKIIKLLIKNGILLSKELICSICTCGNNAHKFGVVWEYLEKNKQNKNTDLIEYIIKNSAHMPTVLTWCSLSIEQQTFKNLTILINLNSYMLRIEKKLTDNIMPHHMEVSQFQILFESLKQLSEINEHALKSILEKANAVHVSLQELKTSQSLSGSIPVSTLPLSKQTKPISTSSHSSSEPISDISVFKAKLEACLLLPPPRQLSKTFNPNMRRNHATDDGTQFDAKEVSPSPMHRLSSCRK